MRNIRYIFIFFFILIPAISMADGFIVVPGKIPGPRPERRSLFPLEVKYHHVNVKIKGLYAETKIDQEFYNGSKRRLEGHYIFPVPKGAVIRKFSMFINGKETPAELLSAKKARRIYEDIVRRQIDPALLEYYDLNIFKARIFPIEPFSTKRVKISYSEILTMDNGTVSYIYPLNTEKFSSKPLKKVKIDVSVKSKERIKNIYSTSHDVRSLRKSPYQAEVSYERRDIKPDKDFRIYYSTADRKKLGISLLTSNTYGKDGFFFMNISPDIEIEEKEIQSKNLAFVLDVSGSMAGIKLKQAKKALNYCVNSLNKRDRFEIISFSTESESLFGRLKKADSKNIDKAERFIRNLRAVGGTNIEEALSIALSNTTKGEIPLTIIFLTDGKPTIGKTKEKDILDIVKRKGKGRVKVFTFGIGEAINVHLLDRITTFTNSYRSYVAPDEDIEIKVSDFFSKIRNPVFTNVKIKTDGVRLLKVYPNKIPDIYKGSSITLIGRYRGTGRAKISISGLFQGREKVLQFRRDFKNIELKNRFIPSLWAARRVGFLLDQIRLNGESKELKDEITRLARKYGIITPYTSFLIVEDERTSVSERRLKRRDQTLRNIIPERSGYYQNSREEYSKMKGKFGKKSIRASKEVQALNMSRNHAHTKQGRKRMNYMDKTGIRKNLTDQIKYVHGRAVYNSGKLWVDSLVRELKVTAIKIRFNSKAYYRLIYKKPAAVKFLALGRNVRFVMDKKVYEIYE